MNEQNFPTGAPAPLPTAYPVPLQQAPARSAWPMVIGIISIFLATVSIVFSVIGIVVVLAAPDFVTAENTALQLPPVYSVVITLFDLILDTVLLAAGIQLLRRRPAARMLHLVCSWGGIAIVMVSLIVNVAFLDLSSVEPFMRTPMVIGVIFGSLFALAYPVFVLVWFYRRKIADEVSRWGAADNRFGGPQPI